MNWNDVPDGSDAGNDAADETGFVVTSLTNTTEYAFEVRAVNVVGEGVKAGPETATPMASDTTAPTFRSAAVDGDTLVITMSENLAAAANLANSAFTVKKTPNAGSEATVSLSGTPSISGATVTLTLAAAVVATDGSVKVSYTKPSTDNNNRLEDATGNEVASFTDEAVTNNTAAQTPLSDAIVLVKNTAKTQSGTGSFGSIDHAQAFTTGANSDNGFTLTSVDLVLARTGTGTFPTFNVRVTRSDSSGNPALGSSDILGTLDHPTSLDSDIDTFKAPGDGIELDDSTTYFVFVDVTNGGVAPADITISNTSSNDEDTGSASGWSIGDSGHFKDLNGSTWATFDQSRRIAVKGYANTAGNTAPTASNAEVTTDEDVDYTFKAGDFNFSDTDTGDALDSVKITSLPDSAKGALELDGTAIAAANLPQTVTKTQLDENKLVYKPPDDANGNDYTSFSFKVNDGDDDSASSYTMTIDVDPLPDVTNVEVTSTPTSGTADPKDTYGLGEKIQVTVTFDENVDVDGDPTLGVLVGTNTRLAAYTSGTGTTALVFEYTVVAADTDTDGVSIAADALTVDSNDKIEDSDDQAADVTFTAVAADTAHKVNGSLTPPVNNPPTVENDIPDQFATVGTALSYAFAEETFADDDGDTLTYTATKGDDNDLPTWLTFTATTRTFSGTPQTADLGTLTVKVTADDSNGGTVSDEFDLVVSKVLISNIGRTADNSHSSQRPRAQRFTTGSHTGGYSLTGAEIFLGSGESGINIESVAVCETEASGFPSSTCTALNPPSNLRRGNRTFNRPADMPMALNANTEYTLVITPKPGESVALGTTRFTSEDPGGAAGWSIGDEYDQLESAGWKVELSRLILRVRITGDEATTDTNNAATGAPAIAGTAQVGQTLTANRGTIADADGLPGGSFPAGYTLQWVRVDGTTETGIVGATSTTYTLTDDDPGKTIKVRVAFIDGAGNPEKRISAATAAVSPLPSLVSNFLQRADLQHYDLGPANSDDVYAASFTTGTTGATLTAIDVRLRNPSRGGVSTVPTVTVYEGVATGSALTLGDALATLEGPTGLTRFTADYTFDAPADTMLSGSTTYFVLFELDGGNVDLVYTTSSTLDGGGQPGWNIPYTRYTRSSANTGPLTGAASGSILYRVRGTVTGANNPATGKPSISGTVQVGETLTANAGTGGDIFADDGLPSGTFPDNYTFKWVRFDADGTSNRTEISGQTSRTYTLAAADAGKTVKVEVGFTDGGGNSETLVSDATGVVQAGPSTGEAVVPADWPLIPTGVTAGHTFRLLIVTSTQQNAEATALATYDMVVRNDVATTGHASIRSYANRFQMLGCSQTVSAVTHTATGSSDTGAPIHWLNGAKVADDYADFYDGDWDSAAPRVPSGASGGGAEHVFHGCQLSGNGLPGSQNYLGDDSVTLGAPGNADRGLGVSASIQPLGKSASRRYYGLSRIFRVAGASNDRPRVDNEIPVQSATAGEAFSFSFDTNTFTDPDGDTLSYSATQGNGSTLPSWLTFTPATRTFSGTPAATDVGTLTVKVTASDSRGGTGSDVFHIVVGTAPVLITNRLQTPAADSLTMATGSRVTQQFTTGSNPGGYKLEEVEIFLEELNNSSFVAITFSNADGSGNPTSLFSNNPTPVGISQLTTDAFNIFTVPANTFLSADTMYFVDVSSVGAFDIGLTASNSEDAGGAAGWSIADTRHAGTPGNWTTPSEKLRIAIRGTANNAATGAPVIAGTTHVGQTLTANTGTGGNAFADDDGLPTTTFPTGYTFKWVRFDADGTSNRTEISGATSRTYVLAGADAGKTVKVEVSFTDRAGFSETLVSAASSAILAAPSVPQTFTATPGDARVTLAWTAPADNGGSAVTKYQYRYSTGSTVDTRQTTTATWTNVPDGSDAGSSTADETGFVVTSLVNGTGYAFEVRAVNAVGESVKAGPRTATPASSDTTAPTVISITRQTPSSSPTNADRLVWRVDFSEAVKNVDAADFQRTGTTATLAVAAVPGSDTAYDVTLSSGNLGSLNGTVRLAFATGQNIADAADNNLTATTPSGTNDDTFVVDNAAPTVTIGDVPSTSTAAFTAKFTFTETVSGFVVGDISVGNGAASSFTKDTTTTVPDSVYTALITPTASGAVTVDVNANVASDAAGNGNTAATRVSSAYMTAPGTPQTFTATAGDTQVTLGWTAPASNGGSVITKYQYRYSTGSTVDTRQTTTATWTDVPDSTDAGSSTADETGFVVTSLVNGTGYAFEVRAVNAVGESVKAGPRTATPASSDTVAPTVVSITRQTPSSSPTNANTLVWRVAFSEVVKNVDAADFQRTGTTATLTVASAPGSNTAYDVTLTSGNLAGLSGTVRLTFSTGQNIADAADNRLTATTPTGTNDNTFVVDNTAPTVTITNVPATSAAPFLATFSFNEVVTGFVVGDIMVGNGTAGSFRALPGGRVYTALITPTANGAVTVDVNANVATDAVGNGNAAASRATSTYTAPNNPPVFADSTLPRSVAENAAADSNVGAVIPVATDADNDSLTYTMEGTDAASFAFDGATRQIKTRTNVAYDFEARSSYLVTIKADDGKGGTDTVAVIITLTDVDEPPNAPAAPTVTATSGTTTSLDVSWSAPTHTDRPPIFSYDLRYCAGSAADCDTPGDFTNGPQNVTGTSATITGLPASTIHQVQVRATNDEGDSDWSSSGSGSTGTPANNPPVFADNTLDRSIVENAAAGSDVDAVIPVATDVDGDTLTYTMEGADASSFTFDATARQIKTRTGETYDFEDKPAYSVIIKADDRKGGADTATVAIILTDVDEPPDAPGAPTVTANAGSTTSLDVSWSAPANTGRPPIASYDLRYCAGSRSDCDTDSDFTNGPQDVTGTSATIAGLAESTAHQVQVRATNDEGDSGWSSAGSGTTGTPANRPPKVVNPISGRAVTAGTALSLTFPEDTFRDDDGDPLTYRATQADDTRLPTWLRFDAATRTFSGTPTATDVGVLRVKVTASDGTDSGVHVFTIVVSPVPGTLVSNMAKDANGIIDGGLDYAQEFTTGSGSGGYVLSSVEIFTWERTTRDLETSTNDPLGEPSVSLCPIDGGDPGTDCTALTAPASFATGLRAFTAPAGTTLAANTTYAVVISTADGEYVGLGATTSGGEDFGAAAGWRIAGTHKWFTGGTWKTDGHAVPFRIALKGTARRVGRAAVEVAKADESGPADVSVADARVREGPGAMLDFVVTLSDGAEALQVSYETADGTATAGEDYTAASGSLFFASGETRRTVSVTVLDDAHDEGHETMTLRLTDVTDEGRIVDGEATGTIDNSDPLPAAWIGRLGRATADNIIEAVGRRWDRAGQGQPEAHFTLGGWRLETLLDGFGRDADAEPRPRREPDETEVRTAIHADESQWARMDRGGEEALAHGALAGNGPALGNGLAADDGFAHADRPRGAYPGSGAASASATDVGLAAGNGPQVHSQSAGTDWHHVLNTVALAGGDARWARWLRQGTALVNAPRPSWRGVLANSSFHYAPRSGEESGGRSSQSPGPAWLGDWAAWGETAATRFSGADGALSLDGDVGTAVLGFDRRRGRWLTGVALSYTEAVGAFSQPSLPGALPGGVLDSTLTTLSPYAHFELGPRTRLWGVLGYGTGDLALTPANGTTIETGLRNALAAFGSRTTLRLAVREAGRFELAVRSDARFTETTSDVAPVLMGATRSTSRVRALLEGRGTYTLPGGGTLTPTLEAGLRHDGGDAETGTGLEMGVGLGYDSGRFNVRLDARGLLAHEDAAYGEWGYSAMVGYHPREDGLGLSMNIGSVRGTAQSDVQSLWNAADAAGVAHGATVALHTAQRLRTELGYGFESARGRLLWTPYLNAETEAHGGRTLGLGLRLSSGPYLRATLELGRRDNHTHDAGQSAQNSMHMQWIIWW